MKNFKEMCQLPKTTIERHNLFCQGPALAALFGWLLSFPMFGCLLMETAGEKTLLLGLVFVISHGLGLFISGLLTAKKAPSRVGARIVGAIIAALTVVYAFIYGAVLAADIFIMAVLGFSAAYLVAEWTARFSVNPRPLRTLVVAMAGANIVTAGVNMPVSVPEKLLFFLLAALATGGVFAFTAADPDEAARPISPGKNLNPQAMIMPLAAYTVAIYLIGGIWYNSFSLQMFASPLWEKAIGFLLYSGGIVLMALPATRGQAASLATYSLSLLGVGLAIALTQTATPVLVWVHHAAFNLGFAAADLFFWYALWTVAQFYPARRVFGLGLGASLLLIGLSTAVSAAGWSYGFPVLLFVTALTLLFLIVPLISRNPFNIMNQPPASEAVEEAVEFTPAAITDPPEILTAAEKKIYLLLMQGASDSEIAAALFISKNTVKFHVRNILHKLEAKNRKELLLHFITDHHLR